MSRAEAGGVWPRTNRVLPWLVAGFLVMVWMVPFDSTTAPFKIGVDSKLDRVLLVVIVGVWAVLACAGGRYGPRFRRSPLNVAILAFVVVVTASIVTQLPVLSNTDLLKTNVKQLALLMSYFTFFYLVVTVVRREEVEHFLKFMVILACLTAIGTIIEYRFHTNYFYSWTAAVLKGFTVKPPPVGSIFGRRSIVGPTATPLADATVLSIALSFGLVFLFRARRRGEQVLWLVALGLLLSGTFATGRKSAVLIPLVTLLALAIYRPRQMLRFLPFLAVLLLSTYVIAPHALTTLRYEFLTTSTSVSTRHRTAQYAGVVPYILSHPFLGVGWGTYASTRFGILDDQYLGIVVQTGFLGLAAFIGLLITGVLLAHRATRSSDRALADLGLALMGAIAGFAIASATFDVLAFPQAPYLLMFILALTVVASERGALPGLRPSPMPGLADRAANSQSAQSAPVAGTRTPAGAGAKRRRVERARRSLALLALGSSVLAGGLGFVIARSAGAGLSAPAHPPAHAHFVQVKLAYADALNAALTRLNKVRPAAGSKLAHATDARAQASAAGILAAAHAEAAATLAQLDAGASRSANATLASALRSESRSYEAIARAALRRDARAYREATASLARSNSDVRRAIDRLGAVGYSVGGR